MRIHATGRHKLRCEGVSGAIGVGHDVSLACLTTRNTRVEAGVTGKSSVRN